MGSEDVTAVVLVCVNEESNEFGGKTVVVVNGFHTQCAMLSYAFVQSLFDVWISLLC